MKFKQLVRKINNNDMNRGTMQFREISGYHCVGDKMLQVNTFGKWSNVTFEDVLRILKSFMDNQEKIYPRSEGMMGDGILMKAVDELHVGVPVKKILEKYGDKHLDI